MNIMIRPMGHGDLREVLQIYNEGILTGNATFTTQTPSAEEWNKAHLTHSRLVAEVFGAKVAGWAALLPVSPRDCFKGVAEESIYVSQDFRGQGIGQHLIAALIEESERNGMWTLQAAIFPENEASLSLHYKAGFQRVGTRKRIAALHGQWRDTILLERRSQIVGL